jgi:uncharacterized protein YjbI with pentapeptide repeats
MPPNRAKPRQPSEPNLGPLTPFDGDALEESGDHERVEFVEMDLAGARADTTSFVACRFERCGFDGASLQRTRAGELILADCHATSLDVTGSTWRDSLLTGGRFGAIVASRSAWTEVTLRGCKLDFVDLSAATLAGVVFEDCVVGEVDLAEARVRSVTVSGGEVRLLNVAGARVERLDISGSAVAELRGIESLRGTVISPSQLHDLAPLLAAHLGIRIREG